MCAGSSGRHRGGFPCGRWATLGDMEEEEGEQEKEGEDEDKKEKEEGEIPCLLGSAVPGGNSLLGNTFPFCSLISIAGACPRERETETEGPQDRGGPALCPRAARANKTLITLRSEMLPAEQSPIIQTIPARDSWSSWRIRP